MSRKEILLEIVVIYQRSLDRCLALQQKMPGAISDQDIDKARLDLLEAQLRLIEEKP